MTKAKFTKSGNVKVTMSHEQYLVISAILGHTRLGTDNWMGQAIGRYLIDTDRYNSANNLNSAIDTISNCVSFSYTEEEGHVIELGTVAE